MRSSFCMRVFSRRESDGNPPLLLARRYSALYDDKLCAVAALRLAGFSSGTGVCVRGAVRWSVSERIPHSARRVLRSVQAVSFFPWQEKRNGLRYVPFLFCEVGIASCKLSCLLMVIGLWWFTSGLCVSLWRFRRGTKGTRRTESAVWRSVLLCNRIGLAALSAGSTLGAARPQTCAKEPLALWTLFTLGRVMLAEIRFVVIRVHGKTRLSPICARAGRAV